MSTQKPGEKKLVAGILAIVIGSLGIHKFYLGYNTAGIIMLVASILCIGAPIMSIIGIVEGIIYLTKSDEDFDNTYVYNKKEWF